MIKFTMPRGCRGGNNSSNGAEVETETYNLRLNNVDACDCNSSCRCEKAMIKIWFHRFSNGFVLLRVGQLKGKMNTTVSELRGNFGVPQQYRPPNVLQQAFTIKQRGDRIPGQLLISKRGVVLRKGNTILPSNGGSFPASFNEGDTISFYGFTSGWLNNNSCC